MSRYIRRAFERLLQLFSDLAGAMLVALMLITVVDIVARRAGLFSVRGIIEISTMAVVLIAFLALPYSFIVGGHIVIDLATTKLSKQASRRLDALWLAVCSVCLAVIAWLMWRATIKSYNAGDFSMDLQVPMVAFLLPATIGITLAPIACLIAMVRNWKGLDGGEMQVDREIPREPL